MFPKSTIMIVNNKSVITLNMSIYTPIVYMKKMNFHTYIGMLKYLILMGSNSACSSFYLELMFLFYVNDGILKSSLLILIMNPI